MKLLLNFIERFSLTVKLALGFASLMLVALAIGLHSLYTQRELTREIQFLYEKELLGVSHIKEARINYAIMGRAVRQYLLAPDATGRDRALKQLLEAETAVRNELEEARKRTLREENLLKLTKFNENFANYKQNIDKVLAMAQEGRQGEALAYVGTAEFQRDGITANEVLAQVAQFKEKSAMEESERARLTSEKGTRITLLLVIAGVGAGLLFALLIAVSIRRPTEQIRAAVEKLTGGELDQPVPYTDYSNEIGELARSIETLRGESIKLEGERWLKTHIAAITNELQSAGSFSELAQKFFSNVAPLIHLGHGVFYIYLEEQQKLRLLCGYAQSERKNLDQFFSLGQGLVGQCALERTPIIISKPPPDYIRISSGMGTAAPKMIAAIPVLNGKRLLAVIELATYELFKEKEQALFDALMPVMAMSIDILDRNIKTLRLLEETKRQAEGMELQAARLEEQAIEMEAQQSVLKETTDSLAFTEERSRLILGSIKEGLCGLDLEGNITFLNHAGEDMLGFTEAEMLGRNMHDMVHHTLADGDHYPAETCHMRHTMQDGTPRTIDNEVLWRKDGGSFPAEYTATPIYKDGQIVGSVISFRDLTERKKVE